MHLFLLRHGDALDPVHGDDASRPLSKLGEEQARVQGRFLHSSALTPEVIVASPLLRAQQTAEIVRVENDVESISTSEHLTPSSDQRNIIRELHSLRNERVLLVGHEPHLSTLLSLLLTGSRGAQIEMKKASLACVEVVERIGFGGGKLEWIIPVERTMELLR